MNQTKRNPLNTDRHHRSTGSGNLTIEGQVGFRCSGEGELSDPGLAGPDETAPEIIVGEGALKRCPESEIGRAHV